MGMDLIVALCPQRHPERTSEELRQLVEALSQQSALELYEDVTGMTWGEAHEDRPDAAECQRGVRALLLEALEVAWGESYHRSIFLWHGGPAYEGPPILVGGGDSWGDTPAGLDAVTALAAWGEW